MLFVLANTFDDEARGAKVRVKAFVLTAFLLLLPVVPVVSPFGGDGASTAVYAQQRGTSMDERRIQPQQNPRTGTSDLPDWAQPSETTRRSTPSREDEMRTRSGPEIPGDGNRNVPLGGLEWLILAGAGYGLFKLRDEE